MVIDLTDEEVLDLHGGTVPESVKSRLGDRASDILQSVFDPSPADNTLRSALFRCVEAVKSGKGFVTSCNQSFDGSGMVSYDFSIHLNPRLPTQPNNQSF